MVIQKYKKEKEYSRGVVDGGRWSNYTQRARERESRNNIRGSLKEEGGGELPDVKSVKILLARLSKHDIPQFIFIKSWSLSLSLLLQVGVEEEEDNARDVRLLLVVPSSFLHFLLSKTSGRASNPPKRDAPTREANLLRRQRSMVKRRNESQKNIERRRRR
jgi:hypothetical protein